MCEKTIDQLSLKMEEKLKRLSEDIKSTADRSADEIRMPEKKAEDPSPRENE